MFKITYTDSDVSMLESLLAENHTCVVTVHRGRITKIQPVNEIDACVAFSRPVGVVENEQKLREILHEDYGEYVVTVCYGQIVKVSRVERESAVIIDQCGPNVPDLQEKESSKKKAGF